MRRLSRLDVDQARHRVVGAVLFARQRLDRELQRLGAGGAGVEQQRLGLDAAVRPERDLARGQDLVAVAHA